MHDLNDLNYFAAVVAHRGFSAAGRALGLPKSRISRRVAALEEGLGVRLLERSTRNVKVTDVGETIYGHARAALSEAQAIEEIATRMSSEPRGLVRMTCPIGVDRLIAARLPALLERYPDLRLQVIATNRRVDLYEENFDVAVRSGHPGDGDASLQMKQVGHAGAILVATPALVQAHGRPMRPADLAAWPTVGQGEGAGPDRWELIDDDGAEEEVVLEPRLHANTLPIIRRAVLDGIGVGLLPEFACAEPLAEGRLERVLPTWRRRNGMIYILFKTRRGLLPSVRAVIDFAADALSPRRTTWSEAL
jgi:DNA-binding transcriptional LysR family regulator